MTERPSRDALLATLEQIVGMRVPPIVAKVARDALRVPDLEAADEWALNGTIQHPLDAPVSRDHWEGFEGW